MKNYFNIENEGGLSASVQVVTSSITDKDGKHLLPDEIAVVIDDVTEVETDDVIMLSMTKKQAVGLAAHLLELAFSDEEERQPYEEPASIAPVLMAKGEAMEVLGFALTPNDDVMHRSVDGEFSTMFLATRKNMERLATIIINQLNSK